MPISSSLSSIPPNDRDQALIDSAALHQPSKLQHQLKPGYAVDDRTPASSSPPRVVSTTAAAPVHGNAAAGTRAGQPAVQHGFVSPSISQQQTQSSQQPFVASDRRREASSDDDDRYVRPSVGTTLANASAALSSSSSTELLPKAVVAQRQPLTADAGKSVKAGAGANLSLDSLPAPAIGGAASQSLTTAKPQSSAADPFSPSGALSHPTAATPKAQQAGDVSAAPALDSTALGQPQMQAV